MKSHLLQAHWLLTGFLGWNLLASICSLADRAVLVRAGIKCGHHWHRRGGEQTSPRLAQAHTAAGCSPQPPCAEPRSPAGKLSQGVGTALRPHISPRLCFLRCLVEGGDLHLQPNSHHLPFQSSSSEAARHCGETLPSGARGRAGLQLFRGFSSKAWPSSLCFLPAFGSFAKGV